MKTTKVTILTMAYNAEKYIAKAIESVLNQTDGDLEFIIRNNGSTDKTGEIIKDYAKNDHRIICMSNKVNWVLDEDDINWWPTFNGEYVAILDADDYLDETFIEVMYKAAKENDADLTVCGTTMFMEDKILDNNIRIPPNIITKNMKDLESTFIDLYGTLRTVWGKLYNTEFYLENYEFAFNSPIHGSSLDTYSVLGYLQKCRSFVAINKSLHFYFISDNTSSRNQTVDLTRIKESEILFMRGKECLNALGILTHRNLIALHIVHKNSIIDLMNLILKSETMNALEKVRYYQAILSDQLFNFHSMNIEVKDQTLDLFMKYFEEIAVNEIDSLLLGKDDYLARLYLCYREIKNDNINLLTLPRLLSVICDSNNKYLIGDEYLTLKWNVKSSSIFGFLQSSLEDKVNALKDINIIRDIFSRSDNPEDFNVKNEKINELINNKQFEEALDVLNDISVNHPLSKDCLLYRIYLSYLFGDYEFAIDACNIALFFWEDCEDIANITQDLFNEILIKRG